MIIGIPIVVAVAWKLYDIQTNAHDAQIRLQEERINILKDVAASQQVASTNQLERERQAYKDQIAELEKQIADMKNKSQPHRRQKLHSDRSLRRRKSGSAKPSGLRMIFRSLNLSFRQFHP